MKNTLDLFINKPDQKYTGYIWLSDEERPVVLHNATFDFTPYNDKGANPFIIEALLYCESNVHSYIIRHTHRYIVSVINTEQLEKDIKEQNGKIEEQECLAHSRLKGIEKLTFKQYWAPEIDEDSSPDFPMLQLKANVFTGFILKK